MNLYRLKEYSVIGREIELLRAIVVGGFETHQAGVRFRITGYCGQPSGRGPYSMFYGLRLDGLASIAFYFRDEDDEWRVL